MRVSAFIAALVATSTWIAACHKQPEAHEDALPVVRVDAVDVAPVANKHTFLGRVEAMESVELRARVEGFLDEVTFAEGKTVEAGDTLFQIEEAVYRANLKEAQASLARARAERKEASHSLSRRKALVASDAVSQESVEEAERRYVGAGADIRSAEAAVDRAKLELNYTTVTAPISGRISKAAYTHGNLVGPDSGPLATVVQLDPIRVQYSVPDRDRLAAWAEINPDSLADFESSFVPRLTLPNGKLYPHPGRIDFSANAVDPHTGGIAVWAEFPNPDSILLPGHLVSVESSMATTQPTPVVSQAALQQDREGTFVYVVNSEGIVERRDIEPGETVGSGISVRSGLEIGEQAIVAGFNGAIPGERVEAVSFTAPEGSPAEPR